MSGWNVYTSQSAVWMISSITEGSDANVERAEGDVLDALVPRPPPDVGLGSEASGERAKELSNGDSSKDPPSDDGEPPPLRRLRSVDVRLFSTTVGLDSRTKSAGLTSLKSWSGNAPFSVAIRRKRVLRADG